MDLSEINRLVTDAQNEMASFNGGRAAAATRARKSLLLIKKQSDSLRKQILEQQKSKKQPKVKADAVADVVADKSEKVEVVNQKKREKK